MRILATSDLHYNVPRSKASAVAVAQQAVEQGGDVLIVAGDIASSRLDDFEQGLALFDKFSGTKLLVAGNHDLWTAPGGDSYEKWAVKLPEISKRQGFVMLDHEPVVVDGIGFVGNVGWYDYSFRRDDLAVPMAFYRAKIGPGRAMRLTEWEHLLTGQTLNDRHRDITTAWRDGEFVRLDRSDEAFTEELAERLERHLDQVATVADEIVVVLHHLPRRELVWYRDDPSWDFAAAFLGSDRFQRSLERHERVRLCLSGHNHRAEEFCDVDRQARYVTIGSTYRDKSLMEFEIGCR